MLETKHSPLPWKLVRFNDLKTMLGVIVDANGRMIIDIVSNGIEQAQANGNLALAAPKLLAACKEFVRFSKLPDNVNRGDYIRYQVSAIGAAEKAIAEAAGEIALKGSVRVSEFITHVHDYVKFKEDEYFSTKEKPDA